MTVVVQDVKDTFYEILRDRIAANNPARTVVVRGLLRPGVIVVENELPGAAVDGIALVETFCLRWAGLHIDTQGNAPLTTITCEIRYATDGGDGSAGLDRGRTLAAMEEELSVALAMPQQNSAENTVAETVTALATNTTAGTNIFWGAPTFAPAVMRAERMERTATLEVFGYGS